MALVTGVVLPNNGDRIKTENYNDPINKILTQFNGNIDSSNIAAGSLPWSVMSAQTGVIPDSSLVDTGGWRDLPTVPTVVTNYGQKEHLIRYAGVDHSGKLQAGSKIRIPRTGSTPTTSMAFVAASSQYAQKTSPAGITFTDDFTCEAWVYLDSYPTVANGASIIGRFNGTSGWLIRITQNGQVDIYGSNGTSKEYTSYQSIPLGKWVHVAATLDMSGSVSVIYIDGVSVPNFVTGAGTVLAQAGDLQLGAYNSGQFCNGKIANARVWSTIRSAAEIRNNMNQETPASATGLVAHFKGNGSWNDSSVNANHLTAANGAVNNSATHPYSAIEYAIATKVQYAGGNTDVTVTTGSGALPNETIGQTSFSNDRTPYGFPTDSSKWTVTALFNVDVLATVVTNNVWVQVTGASLTVPLGNWRVGMKGNLAVQTTAVASVRSGWVGMATTLPTDPSTSIKVPIVTRMLQFASQAAHGTANIYDPKILPATTVYNVYVMSDAISATESAGLRAAQGPVTLFAENPYV